MLCQGFNKSKQSEITIITANIVLPFAISALLGIINRDKFAMRLVIAGFIIIALMKL